MKLFSKLFGFFYKNSFSEGISNFELYKIDQLSKKLNLKFNNPLLFAKALTHRSYLEKETELSKSNERLEFLGDAILGAIVAETLFTKFPEEAEGFLTKTRSHIVYKNALYEAALRLGLKDYLLYDKRFIKDTEEGIKTILSDCLEALIGAIYLDNNLEITQKFVFKWIIDPNLTSGKYQIDKNFKGQLLEYTHSEKLSPPNYIIVSSNGPDHKKEFIVEVQINEDSFGKGTGKNKKSAEQEAAKNTLNQLRK
jgi:ribonuclease-3